MALGAEYTKDTKPHQWLYYYDYTLSDENCQIFLCQKIMYALSYWIGKYKINLPQFFLYYLLTGMIHKPITTL